MAFIGNIGAILSADTSDFKSKMEDAGQAAEKFDKQIKKFGLGFGGVAAIATAFRAVVDYARDLENPMDSNLRMAKEFATGLDSVKNGMLEIGAKALGVVNSVGEWVQKKYQIIRYGEEVITQGEEIARQADATIAAIEKDKKLTQEIADLRKQAADLAKRTREEQEKQLSASERLLIAVREYQAAQDVINQSGMTRKQNAEAEVQLAEKKLAYTKALAEVDKENRASEKKATEEQVKADKELADIRKKESEDEGKRYQKAFEEKRKLQFDALSNAEKEKVLLKELEAINKDLGIYKKGSLEYAEAEVEKLEKTKQLTELRTTMEPKVTDEKKKQLDLATEEAKKILELARGFSSLTVVGGRNTEQLTDQQLRDKIRNLQRQIGDMQAQEFSSSRFALSGADPTGLGSVLQAELERAQNEQNLRRTVAQRVSAFGELGARATFQGKEDVFERILEKLGPTDEVKRTAAGVEELNARLASLNIYPRR